MWKHLWVVLIIWFYSVSVAAFELGAELYSNVNYSDNISKENRFPDEDISQTLGLNISLVEKRKIFQADADLNLEKEHYYMDNAGQNNAGDGETTLTTGVGLVNLGLVEAFLDWKSSFKRIEVLNDPLADQIPGDREIRDLLRTGPEFTYKASDSADIILESIYVLVENSDPDVPDPKRLENSLSLRFHLDKLTDLSLNGEYEKVLEGDGAEFSRNIGFNVGISRAFVRGNMALKIGRARLLPEESDKVTSTFIQYNLSRQINEHDVKLNYTQDITDTAVGFEEVELEEDAVVVVSGSDIVEKRRFNLSASRQLDQFIYKVQSYLLEEDFGANLNDERSRGINVRVDQLVEQGLTVGYEYDFVLRHHLGRPDLRKEKTHTYSVDTRYNFSKDLSFNSSLQYAIRLNDRLQAREYEEWSLGVGFSWILH